MQLLKNDILSKHIPSLPNINIKNKYSIYTKIQLGRIRIFQANFPRNHHNFHSE